MKRTLCCIFALLITGCATTKPATITIPIPCPAASEVPEAPERILKLDETKPGEVVQAYAANRARWIGYADSLRARLDACK